MNRTLLFFVVCACFSMVKAQLNNPHRLPYQWKTDTANHTVALSDLTMATAKNSLPTLDYPKFIQKGDKKYNFYEHEPVICISFKGKSKAYPLSLLTMYELSNDSLGGEELMITYCPMCNAAMVFNRRVKNKGTTLLLDFSISGILMHNDMVMYDRQTETWWEQLMGEAIVGELAGTELKMMRALIISAKDYFDRYPDGLILSPADLTTITKRHNHRPFYHMDHDKKNIDTSYYLPEKVDPRLPPLERVLDIHVEGHTKIYPFEEIAKKEVINDVFDNMNFVIFYHGETVSVLDEDKLSKSKRTGSATAFRSNLDGVNYTFHKAGNYFTDDQTGSTWDITGYCKDGALKGKQLWILPHSNHFAFAYLAFFRKLKFMGSKEICFYIKKCQYSNFNAQFSTQLYLIYHSEGKNYYADFNHFANNRLFSTL